MSWRAILGMVSSTESPSTQNSQNPQKTHLQDNNAYCANIALRKSKLFEALATICQNLPITAIEVHEALSQQDIEDWYNDKMSINELEAFSSSLVQRKVMDQGKTPSHYTQKAICKWCGPIWLWISEEVLGCPWCWNRATGKPISHPFEH